MPESVDELVSLLDLEEIAVGLFRARQPRTALQWRMRTTARVPPVATRSDRCEVRELWAGHQADAAGQVAGGELGDE